MSEKDKTENAQATEKVEPKKITFADLGLSEIVLDAIKKKGFEEPTEIQAKAIPLLLESDDDIIAQALTGTGKTATFGLVFADKLTPKKFKSPQAIVLAPTRELAIQVSEELNSLKGKKNFSIIPIYGGQSWGMQRRHLNMGVDIVVGTPGRIMDHLEKGTLNLENIEYFVLDEADEMLNMGFVEDIETILQYTNSDRKTLLFSATMPSRIANLAKKYMNNPQLIKTQANRIANNKVDQIYFEVPRHNTFEALCRIIDMEEEFYGIIFCRTKVSCEEVSKHLNDRGYRAAAFHGDISQDRREQLLRNFKKKQTEVLVCTDVAARGIDIADLTHVINYALPQDSESYVHRIGRTGRAGKAGKAITLITPAEYRKLRMFERHAKAKIEKQVVPDGKEMVELKKRRLMSEMAKVLESSDLGKFEEMAGEMFEGEDSVKVVAALLKYSFSKSLDISEYKDIKARATRNNDRSNNRSENGKGFVDGSGKARLFLTTGREDGATPGKILHMIDNDFGVKGDVVGEIDIMDKFSFVSVPLAEAEIIMEAFQQMKKGGQRPPVRIERAQGGKNGGGGRGGSRGRGGNRRGGNRGGYKGGGRR